MAVGFTLRASHETHLIQYAKKTLEESLQRMAELQNDIREADRLKAEAKAELELVADAQYRFDNLEQKLRDGLPCPECWIKQGVHQRLEPTSENSFQCERCGEKFDL
jgi:hypothetical protein